jgi:ElaB/YqjD/DUF883 family membrane-anchored ribosome-binding protein
MFNPTDQTQPGNGDLRPLQSVVDAGTGASREFHSFVADVEDLVTSTTPLTVEDLARAKEKLRQQVTAVKASIETMRGDVADQARQTAAATNHYVHENPWKSAGIGAAVGLLLGFILARRH